VSLVGTDFFVIMQKREIIIDTFKCVEMEHKEGRIGFGVNNAIVE